MKYILILLLLISVVSKAQLHWAETDTSGQGQFIYAPLSLDTTTDPYTLRVFIAGDSSDENPVMMLTMGTDTTIEMTGDSLTAIKNIFKSLFLYRDLLRESDRERQQWKDLSEQWEELFEDILNKQKVTPTPL